MNQQKNTAAKFTQAEKRQQIIALRKGGANFRQIGESVGCTEQNAFQIFKRELDRINKRCREDVEQERRLDLERLDSMLMGVWAKATSGNETSIQAALKIMERRAKLLGMDKFLETVGDIPIIFQIGIGTQTKKGHEPIDVESTPINLNPDPEEVQEIEQALLDPSVKSEEDIERKKSDPKIRTMSQEEINKRISGKKETRHERS